MNKVSITKEASAQKLGHRIWKADLMFRAYQHDLSPRGRELALLTNRANKKIGLRQFDAPEVQRTMSEVLSNMPNPKGTNLLDSSETSWLKWFAINSQNFDKGTTDPIGEGCLEPCSFCERENISGWSKDNPLYVVAAAVRNSFEKARGFGNTVFFQGAFANNVLDWLDPFFHFDIGSLAASLAMLDCNVVFAPITKAFNSNDPRMVMAARTLSRVESPNYRNSIILSFHLGIASPEFDIIKSVADSGGGRIPEEIIDRYAQRYAENFLALGSAINRAFYQGEYIDVDTNCDQALDKTTGFTRVNRKSDGTVLVVNPRLPKEILVQTNMDKLWPIEG